MLVKRDGKKNGENAKVEWPSSGLGEIKYQ